MFYMVRQTCRPALVLPEELHVAISVPCSDKFTVPQHAHRHVHARSEASHALTRPAHSARPARSDTSSTVLIVHAPL